MRDADDRLERPDRKKRLSVYLDPELMRLLADFADRREQSRSIIAEAAIASFLSPDADERKEAAIVKRLDRIDRNIQRLERDIGIANEAFAIFMRSLADLDHIPAGCRPGRSRPRQGRRALRQVSRSARPAIGERAEAQTGSAGGYCDGAEQSRLTDDLPATRYGCLNWGAISFAPALYLFAIAKKYGKLQRSEKWRKGGHH